MSKCRVYLFTYNRNNLLPRAVESIRKQTFEDWICEVHNDNPDDKFPEDYISAVGDERFIMKIHPQNLGAVKSFNLAFAGCGEAYAAILEDDNWWEPTFLEEMTSLLDTETKVNVAWSNMFLWKELENGGWENTGKTTWPVDETVETFQWPSLAQAMSALHSNSALLYRGKNAGSYAAPENSLLNAIELIRERSFEHPLCLNHKPLSNFAITLATHRTNDAYTWIATQIMLLANFIEAAADKKKAFAESITYYRAQKPNPVANFFLCNLLILKDKSLYRLMNFSDWLITGRWLLRNGHKLNYIKRYLDSHRNVYDYLLKHSRARYSEN